ncbi:MAG: response regulator [Campylobacterales bacterium]|nr:response regulator [Campylobacterales bacterium]
MSYHVLLVEDNKINRMMAQGLLKSLGITSAFASDGMEALQMTQQERYDCILMDLQMPVMDGFEAARSIRARGDRTPIIVISGTLNDAELEACRSAGMDAALLKPMDGAQLQSTLARLVAGA